MDGGNTPATPVPSRRLLPALNMAGHTRPAEALSPTNLQRPKRAKNVEFARAPALDLRKGTATNKTDSQSAKVVLENQLRQAEQSLKRKKEVFTAIGDALDKAVASFDGPHQTAARHECREAVNQVLRFLSTHAFASTNGHAVAPHRAESSRQSSGPGPHDITPTSSGSEPTRTASWATVATRAANKPAPPTTAPHAGQRLAPRQPQAPRAAPPDTRDDLRVLVTLDQDKGGLSTGHPRQPAYTIRAAIVQALRLSPRQVPDATWTRTGYAIVTADAATRDLLLEPGNATQILRICGGSKIARPEKWFRYAVQEVPYAMNAYDGTRIDTLQLIEQEVHVQTGLTPCNIAASRHGANPDTGKGTFIVSFLQPVRPFRLFSTSEMAKLVNKKPPLRLHDPGCQGYCAGTRCKRVPRCHNCGDRLDQHDGGVCAKPTKCANCCGPFRSGHDDCPAKPVYQSGRWVPLGKRARAAVRATGNRLSAEALEPTRPVAPGSTEATVPETTRPTTMAVEIPMLDQPAVAAAAAARPSTPTPRAREDVDMTSEPPQLRPSTTVRAPPPKLPGISKPARAPRLPLGASLQAPRLRNMAESLATLLPKDMTDASAASPSQ